MAPKRISMFTDRPVGAALALLVAGLAAACAPVPQEAASAPLSEVYAESIKAAAVKRPGDVGVALLPITDPEPELVTWGYQVKTVPDGKGGVALAGDTWVTQAAQMHQRCAGIREPALDLRMQQLLGLPPGDASARKVFSFKASRPDIFRPCADPDIATSSCPASVPEGADRSRLGFVLNQMLISYRIGFDQPGYPYTGLGYTWDWKPDSETHHVGLSEYVVRQGASIRNLQATETAEFCAGS
jgi:hypothetical protein